MISAQGVPVQWTDTDLRTRLIDLAEQFIGRRVVVVGDVIADEFITLKKQEWETYLGQVSAWEVDQYLTFF